MPKQLLSIALFAALLTGCASRNYLDTQYAPYRADLKDQPVEVTHTPPAAPGVEIVNPDPTANEGEAGAGSALPAIQNVITGTWTFTTPPTVTRDERKNGELAQFSLYDGRPAPTQTPMVVITVAPAESNSASEAAGDPGRYKVSGTREYILNGNIAKEWTGLTTDGSAFCELIIRRPGAQEAGDVCHAIAIAKTSAERKLALDILGSITWTPTP